jgi:hypothetical protein
MAPRLTAECTLQKVDEAWVLYPQFMQGVQYIYMAWMCTPSSGTSGGSGSTVPSNPPQTTPFPYLEIVTLDDSRSRLSLAIEGNASVSSVEVLLNETSVTRYAGSLGTGITLYGPYINNVPLGTSTVYVQGCSCDGRCVRNGFQITRHRAPSGISGGLTVGWNEMEGTTLIPRITTYGWSLGEEPIVTNYSDVYVYGDGTRVQFADARTSWIYWARDRKPEPRYTARHFTRMTGSADSPNYSKIYRTMGQCGALPKMIGDGDTFVSLCAMPTGYGGAPEAGVEITGVSLVDPAGLVPATVVGGRELSYPIP